MLATRGAISKSVFSAPLLMLKFLKQPVSPSAFLSYLALYKTNLKVVLKSFRATKPCIRLAYLKTNVK